MSKNEIIKTPFGIQKIDDIEINITSTLDFPEQYYLSKSSLAKYLNSIEELLKHNQDNFINEVRALKNNEHNSQDSKLYNIIKRELKQDLKEPDKGYRVNVALVTRDYKNKSKSSIFLFTKKLGMKNEIVEAPYSIIKEYELKSLAAIRDSFRKYGILPELDNVFNEYDLYQRVGIEYPESIIRILEEREFYSAPKKCGSIINEATMSYIKYYEENNSGHYKKNNMIDNREVLAITTPNYKLRFMGFFAPDKKEVGKKVLEYLFIVDTELPNETIKRVIEPNKEDEVIKKISLSFNDISGACKRLSNRESLTSIKIDDLINYSVKSYPYHLGNKGKTTINPSAYSIILALIDKEYGRDILYETIKDMKAMDEIKKLANKINIKNKL